MYAFGVLIADKDHFSIGIDGRCNHPVLTVKWPERQLPSLVALEIIGHQAEISEEDKDALSIGHGGGRSAVIEGVLVFAQELRIGNRFPSESMR